MHGCLRCLNFFCIHNCWNLYFVPEPLWNSDKQKLSNFRIDFFYRGVISPFAIKLFLLPLSFHCSTQNIGFSDSGYVMKPPLFMELCLLQGTLTKTTCEPKQTRELISHSVATCHCWGIFTRSVFFFCFIWGSGVFIKNLGFFDSGQILEMYVVLLYFPFKNTVVSQV